MNKRHQQALRWLCIAVFVLFAAPKINIKIGPLPLYLIDLLIFLTFYHARKLPRYSNKLPYKKHVMVILFMIIINEFINGLLIGTLLQPTYLIVRMSLAISLFFTIPKIIRSPKDLMKILKHGMVGAFITSLLLIFSSLPFTRGISLILLSNPILTPNAVSLSSNLMLAADQGVRGTSLIGVSILSGAFLNVMWPLLFLLLNFYKPKGILKIILLLTIVLVPIAVVMTYSRGAILALFLVVLGLGILLKGKIRLAVMSISFLGFVGFSFIGFDSELFMFQRIEQRVKASFENPYEDERESERIMAYIEPFEHVLEKPIYFFFGEGFARSKVANTPNLSGGKNRSDHAVFAKAYYGFGMLTSFIIISLYLSLAFYTLRFIMGLSNKRNEAFAVKFSKSIFVLLVGFSSWFTFGHAAVSQPRGTMLMFFVFGLVVAQKNILFYLFNVQKKPKR